jgi:hypothetical protein
VFLTGPQFKGVKMLPPGVHFLSFQARSTRDGTLSPPVSTFLVLKPKQVFVRRWDPASEGLVELDKDEVGFCVAGNLHTMLLRVGLNPTHVCLHVGQGLPYVCNMHRLASISEFHT